MNAPNLKLTPAEHAYWLEMLHAGEFDMLGCRILDAHHQAVDENPDDPEGTCAICGFADGWRHDPIDEPARFLHYTQASKGEARAAIERL
jgi:hypothetical protein